MVGKRRASIDKMTHNIAAANNNNSVVSGSSVADDASNLSNSEDEGPCDRRSSDSTNAAASSPSIKSALKDPSSPALRGSEGSGGGGGGGSGDLRKRMARGVSFSREVIESSTSEPEPAPVPPSPVQESPKLKVPISRQPFATSTTSASDEEDTNTTNNDDEEGQEELPEQVIQTHVAREGVVSGRVYRKSVVVGAKPKAADAPPEKEGYLMKKSPAMLVGWQKRFFLTNANGDIEYYKTEADARNDAVQPQGVIMIKYIKLDRGVEVDDKSGELSIIIGAKTVHLKGKDKAEARAWMSSITQWQLHTA